MMHIVSSAKALKLWLKENSLTQEWLAGVLGTTQPTVYRWVTGEFRPDAHFRQAIHHLSEGKVAFEGWFFKEERHLANRFKRKRAREKVLSLARHRRSK